MDFDAFHLVTILLIVRLISARKGNYFCVFLSIPDITSSNEKSVDGNKLCHCGFSRIRTLEDFHHGNKQRTTKSSVTQMTANRTSYQKWSFEFTCIFCISGVGGGVEILHMDMWTCQVFGRLYELIIYCDNSNVNCTNGKKGSFFSFSNWICTVHTRSHPLHLLNYSRTVSHCFSLQTALFAELVSCRLHSS